MGSSTHGVASYAGSVNFESVPVAAVERGGELQLTRGAYNTSRFSAIAQSGLTPSGLAGYARVSGKHARNECAFFQPKFVRDLTADKARQPQTPDDARKAFDALFKK